MLDTSEIDFKLDDKEVPIGEADGTRIGVKGIAKLGKELKVWAKRHHTSLWDIGETHEAIWQFN